ncbi:MAG: hypothetical protein V3V96_02635, partial [Acidiferrobacterales bacterium]
MRFVEAKHKYRRDSTDLRSKEWCVSLVLTSPLRSRSMDVRTFLTCCRTRLFALRAGAVFLLMLL